MKTNKFYLISSAVAISATLLVVLANLPEKVYSWKDQYDQEFPNDPKEECLLDGGVWVVVGEPGGGDDYCDLGGSGSPIYFGVGGELPGTPDLKTPTPQAQAPNSGLPDLNPSMEVVQYCANKAANLGGANISFPLDHTLHVEEWFSESFSHVKCVDDLSNPRTCWGPETMTFEVLLCNGNPVENNDYACKTLPVTLGACFEKREQDDQEDTENQPDPIPPSCEHC